MADWSDLPKELLRQVAERLDTSFDLFRFRTICSSWRNSVEPRRHRLPGHFPILTDEDEGENENLYHLNHLSISNACFVFFLSKRTVYLIKKPSTQPQACDWVSSWLVKVEEGPPNRKSLVNPLKRQCLEFSEVIDIENLTILEIGHEYVLKYVYYCPPPLDESLEMEKVVLMNLDYVEGDFDAFVLLSINISGKLAIFKSSDKKWTILQSMASSYHDVILYKGNFYAVDNTGRTVLVDYMSFGVSLVANPVFGGDQKYFVECKGELLLVDKYLSILPEIMDLNAFDVFFMRGRRTVKFDAYRLDEGSKEWIRVDADLRESVLFLGEDCCFSASVDDLRVSKGNCILFFDSFFSWSGEDDGDDDNGDRNGDGDGGADGYHDHEVRVFDLENRCIKPVRHYPEYSMLFWPPPSCINSTVLEFPSRKHRYVVRGYESEPDSYRTPIRCRSQSI